MNVTDEETERFLKFVDPAYRSGMIEILSNMRAPIIFVQMCVEGSGVDYYYGNYIATMGEDPVLDFKVIGLDQAFVPFKKDDAEFIVSYISRCFDKFKLIFSSSITSVFSKNISGMNFAIDRRLYDDVLTADLFSHNRFGVCLNLSENNADFSNEIWDIVLSDRSNVAFMASEYVSGTYSASDNIKKRIQALYDSLSDSDKLLLELGEDLSI